jgi:hypothetical protein
MYRYLYRCNLARREQLANKDKPKSVAAGETLKRENQNRTNEHELVKIETGALTEI